MISEEETRNRMLEAARAKPERTVLLSKALDCFSAREVVALLALPTFDNSAMDGYAVAAGSCARGGRVGVVGERPAGRGLHLHISTVYAVRVLRRAPVPDD